jgi:hypothetical protein
MITKLKWILIHPWVAHAVSFIGMVGLACPMYRMRAGTSVGLVRYVMDSVYAAVMFPGSVVYVFLPSSYLAPYLVAAVVWTLALWPVYHHRRTKRGLMLSYAVLVPLWGLYGVGWLLGHLLGGGA